MIPAVHHIVPKMHLDCFAGAEPAGQVWSYDGSTGKSFSQITKETAVQMHFYSVPMAAQEADRRSK
jgi:hypothetical protein